MSTIKNVEDVILEMASQSSGPVIEALLVHEDDYDKMKQVLEETEKAHPVATAVFDSFGAGVQVYKWDGSEWLRRKFNDMIPEPGKPIASYNNTLQRMAQQIKERRDGGQ